MELCRLTLTNFKNIGRAELEFTPKINCFLGNNGMGKSNLLDAVYTLSFCKSFTGVGDQMLIRRGENFAMVKGEYRRGESNLDVTLGIAEGKRKRLKVGDKEATRLSSHIGRLPVVMISPQDSVLIAGSGEERRRWIDMVISQSDAVYLDNLIRYNRMLEQRNRMLRDGLRDALLYEAVEGVMVAAAEYIHATRARWIERLAATFGEHYRSIAGSDEVPALAYTSTLSAEGATMAGLLDASRERDLIMKHTTVGPHRDDIEMELNGMGIRRTGSQGQCKCFTIALRMAQFDFTREAHGGIRPLLLLDDIFDKLDAGRAARIIDAVADERFGQIFITDTNRKHLDEIVAGRPAGEFGLWDVDDGHFVKTAGE